MSNIGKMKFCSNKILPLVYDDSLSYYEVLCKVSNKINSIIDELNKIGENATEINELNAELESIRKQIETIESEGVVTSTFARNLLQNWMDNKPHTTNGITFNANADGSVNMYGNLVVSQQTTWGVGDVFLKSGVYTLSGCPAVPNTTEYYRLQATELLIDEFGEYTINGSVLAVDTGGGKTFTIDSDKYCRVYIITGAEMLPISAISAVRFYPAINKGTTKIAYSPFEFSVGELTDFHFASGQKMPAHSCGVVNNMGKVAMSYIKFNTATTGNRYFTPTSNEKIYYNPNTKEGIHMFNPTLTPNANDEGKHSMTCSTMVGACLYDIPYEASCYNTPGKQVLGRYQCDIRKYYDRYLSNEYYAAKLYNDMLQDGFVFKPNNALTNIQPGDVLFFSLPSSAVSNFGNITHCAIFGYWVNDNIAVIIECNLLPKLSRTTKTALTQTAGLVAIGRPPIDKQSVFNMENLYSSSSDLTDNRGKIITTTKPLEQNKFYTLVVKAEQVEDTSVYFGISNTADYGNQLCASLSGATYKPVDNTYIIPFIPTDDNRSNFALYRYHPGLADSDLAEVTYQNIGIYEGLITDIVVS